jgi:hypothetical protein
VEAVLRRRDNLGKNAGGAQLQPAPQPSSATDKARSGAEAAMQPPASPVLALSSGGAVLFSVSMQLRTGRLVLAAAGPDLAGYGVDLATLMPAVRALLGPGETHMLVLQPHQCKSLHMSLSVGSQK